MMEISKHWNLMSKLLIFCLLFQTIVYSQICPFTNETAMRYNLENSRCKFYHNKLSCCNEHLVAYMSSLLEMTIHCGETLPQGIPKTHKLTGVACKEAIYPLLCFQICDPDALKFSRNNKFLLCKSYGDQMFSACSERYVCVNETARCAVDSYSREGCRKIKNSYTNARDFIENREGMIYVENDRNCISDQSRSNNNTTFIASIGLGIFTIILIVTVFAMAFGIIIYLIYKGKNCKLAASPN